MYASGGRLRGFVDRSGVSVFRAWRAVRVVGTQPWLKRFGPTTTSLIADGTVMCVACVHLEELDDGLWRPWRHASGSVGEMRRGSCFRAFPFDGCAIVTDDRCDAGGHSEDGMRFVRKSGDLVIVLSLVARIEVDAAVHTHITP